MGGRRRRNFQALENLYCFDSANLRTLQELSNFSWSKVSSYKPAVHLLLWHFKDEPNNWYSFILRRNLQKKLLSIWKFITSILYRWLCQIISRMEKFASPTLPIFYSVGDKVRKVQLFLFKFEFPFSKEQFLKKRMYEAFVGSGLRLGTINIMYLPAV